MTTYTATYTKLRALSTVPPLLRAAPRSRESTSLPCRPVPPLSRAASGLRLALFAALLALAGVQGCGGGAAQPPKPSTQAESPDNVLWEFGSKALHLDLTAAKDLNSYESRAHSLQICIYQLDKRDAYDPLAGTQDGLDTLLQCSAFDKSVKSAVRIFIQPGENAVHTLDRAEGAQFVAVVCGYFQSTPEGSALIRQIPPKTTESGSLFWKSTIYGPGTLDLSLQLGANAMTDKNADDKGAKSK
jgi:type VI secretion system VasD/TssJ family lipoprotein